tara:strand:+ start:1854 stop:2099 length:246 start_codon:yes stop_codon:yes gene_type:complete
MSLMSLVNQIETVKENDGLFRTWAEIHLSILEKWDKKNWKAYKKSKDSYFRNPYKWTVIATGLTKEEVERNAENIISRYRD